MGCHAPFQGIFPTQGSNLGRLHCRQILYHLSHQGSLDVAIQLLNMFRVYIQKICIKYQSHKDEFLCPRVDDVYCKQPATKPGWSPWSRCQQVGHSGAALARRWGPVTSLPHAHSVLGPVVRHSHPSLLVVGRAPAVDAPWRAADLRAIPLGQSMYLSLRLLSLVFQSCTFQTQAKPSIQNGWSSLKVVV